MNNPNVKHIPTAQKRAILEETVKVFGQQEWFRDATIYDAYPNTGEPTLEFKVNYVPILGPVRKVVMDFAIKHNLVERFLIVDKEGKRVE
jgi:hypothetical protein